MAASEELPYGLSIKNTTGQSYSFSCVVSRRRLNGMLVVKPQNKIEIVIDTFTLGPGTYDIMGQIAPNEPMQIHIHSFATDWTKVTATKYDLPFLKKFFEMMKYIAMNLASKLVGTPINPVACSSGVIKTFKVKHVIPKKIQKHIADIPPLDTINPQFLEWRRGRLPRDVATGPKNCLRIEYNSATFTNPFVNDREMLRGYEVNVCENSKLNLELKLSGHLDTFKDQLELYISTHYNEEYLMTKIISWEIIYDLLAAKTSFKNKGLPKTVDDVIQMAHNIDEVSISITPSVHDRSLDITMDV